MATQTIEVEELTRRLLTDKKFFIENLIEIPDKNRMPVPFKLNPAQELLHDNFTRRDIIVKASQLGCTSLVMALFLVECITKPNTTAVVIAHEEFITQRLLSKAKGFIDSIPDEFKPPMHHKSAYEMSWADINSTFYIGSARSMVFGRGERIDLALLSEIAFWPDPDRILVALDRAMPSWGHLVLESTPNGEDNRFHELYVENKTAAATGSNIYTCHFLPWWVEPSYSMDIEDPASRVVDRHSPLDYSEEEQWLIRNHDLTEAQIRWRRARMASLGRMFFQEYAEDDESCFLQVSDTAFDNEVLNQKRLDCYPAKLDMEIASGDTSAKLEIWYPPEEGHLYIIGADPTVGIHDPAAVTVWDLHGMKHCATLTGLYKPEILQDLLKQIGKYFNNGCLVVENNNPGVAVLGYLMDYCNLYYHVDINTGKQGSRAGWTTSHQTKAYMVQQFRRLLPSLIIHDIRIIQQARNLRSEGLTTVSVGPDDIIMSSMIAIATREAIPTKRGLVGQAGWKRWWTIRGDNK